MPRSRLNVQNQLTKLNTLVMITRDCMSYTAGADFHSPERTAKDTSSFRHLGTSRYYLRREGYVFIGVCLFVCLFVGLRKNYRTDLRDIRWNGGTWATDETHRFWW